jgi:hypothetical protein
MARRTSGSGRGTAHMEDYGERTTGTRDEHYNLVSVLYHALQGADTSDHYAMDAEAAADERLAGFFRETQQLQTEVAERAKEMLGIVASAPEFEEGDSEPAFERVEPGGASGTDREEAGEPTGRGVPPTGDTPRTPPGEEGFRGRGVPPMSDAPGDQGLAR